MLAEAVVLWREDWQSLEDHFPERSLAHLTDWSWLLAGDLTSVPSELFHRGHTLSFPQHPIGYTSWPCSMWKGATKPSGEGHWVSSWRLVATLYTELCHTCSCIIGSMADELPGSGNFQNPSKNVLFCFNPQSEAFKICPAKFGTWERCRGLSQRGQNSKTTISTFSPTLFKHMFLLM